MHKKQQPNNLPTTYVRLALAAGGVLILLALLFTIPPSNRATANSTDRSQAITKYPFISGTRLDSCSLCHASSLPALNPFGSAYLSNGRNVNAFGLIENLDSDGDGFKNLAEINALYFPGDPTDHPPAATSTPTQAASPTPTRTESPTSTPTSTSVPPTSTQTNTSVPPTPTSTNTSLPPTPTQVNTLVPPAATSTNTSLPTTPSSTSTSIPLTPTQANTLIPPTPIPTNTSIPPTVAPTSTPMTPPPTQTSTVVPQTATPASTLIPPTPTSTNPSLPPTAVSTNSPPTATTTSPPRSIKPSPTPSETPPSPVTPPNLDLDIRSVSITSRVPLGSEKLVIIRVQLVKRSQGDRKGILEITGTQNGVEIYHASQIVAVDEKGKSHWFSLPSYIPTQIGRIHWRVQVIDDNPDPDTRTLSTRVTQTRKNNDD